MSGSAGRRQSDPCLRIRLIRNAGFESAYHHHTRDVMQAVALGEGGSRERQGVVFFMARGSARAPAEVGLALVSARAPSPAFKLHASPGIAGLKTVEPRGRDAGERGAAGYPIETTASRSGVAMRKCLRRSMRLRLIGTKRLCFLPYPDMLMVFSASSA